MKFGIYVHIPFCLQRCKYCDFATNEIDSSKARLLPPEAYVEHLEREIEQRSSLFPKGRLDTLYFGGGTPSLLEPSLLERIIAALRRKGFLLDMDTEVTLEINPGTMSQEKLSAYLDLGFNRFSVGCQTFDEVLLKKLGREHSAEDTRRTLQLLNQNRLNFSTDLLFALPGQTVEILRTDVEQILSYAPPHVSPYCLTLPHQHALNAGRPEEETQVKMFELIHSALLDRGYERYEISNYCQPEKHSRHNSLYWMDQPYWGIGLGAHSYWNFKDWGERFWNPNTVESYMELIAKAESPSQRSRPSETLPAAQFEVLQAHEALTDFFHTSLRRAQGLDLENVRQKFGDLGKQHYLKSLARLVERKLLTCPTADKFCLSDDGVVLSNQVFQELTFSPPL